MKPTNAIILGDCRSVLADIEADTIAACITDPPYNYEFIGHKWDHEEIERRISRTAGSKTLVRNIPYGSGLAGGVRNKRWYEKIARTLLIIESGVHNGQNKFSEYVNQVRLSLFLTAPAPLPMYRLLSKMLVFMREI